MNIVTNFESTGFKGQYSTTSGSYTIAGKVSTDAEKNLISINGDITVTASGARVGAFSMSFAATDGATQDAIVAAIKAVRSAVYNDLKA